MAVQTRVHLERWKPHVTQRTLMLNSTQTPSHAASQERLMIRQVKSLISESRRESREYTEVVSSQRKCSTPQQYSSPSDVPCHRPHGHHRLDDGACASRDHSPYPRYRTRRPCNDEDGADGGLLRHRGRHLCYLLGPRPHVYSVGALFFFFC